MQKFQNYKKMYRFIAFFLLFLFAIVSSNGLKILGIYPQQYKSHINYNNAIMSTLAAAGHDITMISPFSECAKENYTFIDISKNMSPMIDLFAVDSFMTADVSMLVHYLSQDEQLWCRVVLELKEMQKMFHSKEKPFDVIFVETATMWPCYTLLARKWKIPVIGTMTLFKWNYADYAIGNPRNPAIIPDESTSNYFHESFYGRLLNTKNYLVRLFLWYYKVLPTRNKIFEKHSHLIHYLDYEEIKPSLLFYNGHSSITPRPMNPNAIEVAGIHIRNVKPLPKDIQNFIDESKYGVVVFTLGSMIKSSTFDEQTKLSLLKAFAAIPQRVIWKFEEKMQNVPDNVLLVKWLPQRDILAHPKTVAFISHCGLSGSYEAIYEAVPVIAIPIFVDQYANAKMIERNGGGLILDKISLTTEVMRNALAAVINDTKYAENMKRLSQRFKDRPLSPQESIVYWTEYVHRHNGAQHLKTPAVDLYWFQYLLLDIIAFVISVLAILVFSMKILIRKIIDICTYKKTTAEMATKKRI